MAGNANANGGRKHDWPSVTMLAVIMASLTAVFLVGVAILALWADSGFDAAAIVAILSPALAAIGTVSAGVFGYSLGSRGTAEAQEAAAAARREEAGLRQEAAPLVHEIQRITARSKKGGPGASGKHEVSEDDVITLIAAANPMGRRLGIETQPEE